VTLYSRFSPSDSAERLSLQAPIQENCIYIIPSPLLGYGILSFISKLPASSTAIGLEIDQDIMALTWEYQTNLIHTCSEKYMCYRVENSRQLFAVFTQIARRGSFRKCCLVPLNAGYRQNKAKYDSLFHTLQHFLKNEWQNRLTLANMAPLWIRNMIENLKFLRMPDISQFHTEKPVLLCGAGESLEETIPLIRKNRNKVYLLSVDTAVQALIRSDVIPDGIVNLEAQFYNLQDFYSIGKRQIDLFSDITAFPPTLRPENFNHYIFTSSFEETTLHKRLREANLLPTEIPPLGSVGVAALYLAGEISSNKIFLTGLDFSYTEGKTHARETPFHDYCRLRENRLTGDVWYSFSINRPSYRAVGKTEGTVTNTILEGYGRQLEDLSRTMNDRVYDLARKGLKLSIPPMDNSSFLSFISHFESRGIDLNQEGTKCPSEKDLKPFMDREKFILEKLIKTWDHIDSGSKEVSEILPVLQECDYLFFHFPDRNRLPNTDPAFLFRVIREARILLRKLS